MKIITKYRDYYDYLVGIYGIDELLVYDRRSAKSLTEAGTANLTVAVCGRKYKFFKSSPDGEWLHTPEEILEYATTHRGRSPFDRFGSITNIQQAKREYGYANGEYTDANKKHRNPVLMYDYDKTWTPVTNLQHIGFHRVMDAHTIYNEISLFLGWMKDNPPIPDNQTSIEKVVSHGFDKRFSFRHRIKE